MAAGAAALVAADRPDLVDSLVLVGPFVRNGRTSAMQRIPLPVGMARRPARHLAASGTTTTFSTPTSACSVEDFERPRPECRATR